MQRPARVGPAGGRCREGQAALAGSDRHSRLPEVLEALLRTPMLAPKALAARLRVAPQIATGLLRDLQAKGVVREVTGQEGFGRLRYDRRHSHFRKIGTDQLLRRLIIPVAGQAHSPSRQPSLTRMGSRP
jgi:hypothetical protein